MSTDKKIVLPEDIEKLLVGMNSSASAEKLEELRANVAELMEKNKKLATELKGFSPLNQTRAYTVAEAFILPPMYLGGTNIGYVSNPENALGVADGSGARFQAVYNPSQNIGQSIFIRYVMGIAVAGTLWVVAKRGPSSTSGNQLIIYGSNDPINGWNYIGTVQVTQPNSSSFYNYTIGWVPAYRFYLVGTAAMGGSAPDSDILVDALGVTY
jgi:hypothetical protein